MRSRARESATADLFTAAISPARRTAPGLGAASPPPIEDAARSRVKHLWYAAVFASWSDTEESAVRLRRLCLHALQFTPRISIEMPNALLLEIKGSMKLFGSLETLHASIDAIWSRLELAARSATAPSTLAALWLARAGKRELIEDPGALAGKLAELPVTATAWDPAKIHTLHALGVTRIGELLRLPRAGLARRFGREALIDLDVALARQAAPRRTFVPRERFRERCDFEAEIETTAYLSQALEPITDRCSRFLRERQAGVQALELRLTHRALPLTRLRFGLASVTSDRRRLADVLVHRLSQLELPAPILRMELRSGPLQPLSAASLEISAGLRGAGRDTAPQLIERLRARLGEQAVYGICAVPEHRPEAAWQRVRALQVDSALRADTARRAGAVLRTAEICEPAGARRPVWLLEQPSRLQASDLRHWRQGEAVLEEGPERIESGWWDGKGIARDYYVMRRAGGERLWVFQERQSKRWYLHGVFA